MLSVCTTKHGSVSLHHSSNIDKKTAHYEVHIHILGEKCDKTPFKVFADAVDAYNAGVKELKSKEG